MRPGGRGCLRHEQPELPDKPSIVATETVQSWRSSDAEALAVRFTGWFCLLVGVARLAAATVLGVLAVTQAAEISAYHNARACLAGATRDADCL